MAAIEANFDGIVGSTHNYSGLSFGNIAAAGNAGKTSNPKKAALQGLEKMKALFDLGFVQGVLPPQERPDINTLKRLGFSGSHQQILRDAATKAPYLLSTCCAASSMWTANAATVSPSPDCADGKVHFTPANLISQFHRSQEHKTTANILKKVFDHPDYFVHHSALPGHPVYGDEGAANHTRFCENYSGQGVEFFVFGQHSTNPQWPKPQKYPARQTFEASQAIARLHQLDSKRAVFAQQNPSVIDQGVFHNDVIAVGNRQLLLCHEQAFIHQKKVYADLQNALTHCQLDIIEVPQNIISVKEVASSYLFNSQILSLSEDKSLLVVPLECRENQRVWRYLQELLAANNSISQVKVFDLRQSMSNGGGPACLRLRVVLNEQELAATHPACLMSDALYKQLAHWINIHYRDELKFADLADPQLYMESKVALDELTQILQLGSIYPFQQDIK